MVIEAMALCICSINVSVSDVFSVLVGVPERMEIFKTVTLNEIQCGIFVDCITHRFLMSHSVDQCSERRSEGGAVFKLFIPAVFGHYNMRVCGD